MTHCTGKRIGRAVQSSPTLDCLEKGQERRALIPVHIGACRNDVVAFERRNRNGFYGVEPQGLGEGAERRLDVAEDLFVIADKVDLVGDHDDMPDPDQAEDIGVPPRLGQQALARIDQKDGEFGVGGAGRHVAGVLLMAGRVGDDELACVRFEKAIGDVDGDALFALGGKPVDQKREIDAGRACRPVAALILERRQLIIEDELAVIEQAPDQGRLAIIDTAAGQKAQQAL